MRSFACEHDDPEPPPNRSPLTGGKGQLQRQGVAVLVGMIVFMWLIEVINTLDSNRLDNDGI